MARNYRDISGDSHLEIEAKWWVGRVPKTYRDQAPRLVRLPDGSDAWAVEGQPLRQVPFDLYGGKGRDVWKPYGQNYETTPGTGPAEQRLKEQDTDGIDAEVLFPGQASGPYFWRYIRDDEAYKACVRAYNEFLAEDYCSAGPDRLLGLGVIPMTNLQDALAVMPAMSVGGSAWTGVPAKWPVLRISGRTVPVTHSWKGSASSLSLRMMSLYRPLSLTMFIC
jgi:hypothetical protein